MVFCSSKQNLMLTKNVDCVRLTDTFVEQLMCELLVLVASDAIVM